MSRGEFTKEGYMQSFHKYLRSTYMAGNDTILILIELLCVQCQENQMH